MDERVTVTGPEVMRATVRNYVETLHSTYIEHVRHLPPAERGALPLLTGDRITVAAAASRRLHLIATTDVFDATVGPDGAERDSYLGRAWTVRFYDPSVLPELGLLGEDTPQLVRRVLGVREVVYHLTVDLGGGLSAHHAQYSGVALANLHARSLRDLDRLRAALPRRQDAVDELGVCARLGLDRAAALLAADLSAGRVTLPPGTPAAACLDAVLAEATQ